MIAPTQGVVAVIGGGAAGYFAAITCAEQNRACSVMLLEATNQPLEKVRISGGGRCNVTHNCFDPAELVRAYPRGYRQLRGAFSRFQPRDTVAWFGKRGVTLKAEPDGRMFPESNQSSTIVDCLTGAATALGVKARLNVRVKSVRHNPDSEARRAFDIELRDGEVIAADRILLATGNSPDGYRIARELGHEIVPCVPSLFTFKITDPRIEGLSGLSVDNAEVRLSVEKERLDQRGPMLITHWGVSGPAILKLSAFGARALAKAGYRATLTINWMPSLTIASVTELIGRLKRQHGSRLAHANGIEPIPRRLWSSLAHCAGMNQELTWANVNREQIDRLARELVNGEFQVTGKGIFKEEFVTCGGVSLKEMDFKTMQSRLCPGLFFAGEILDIDGITGGFNFQNAWTTGWIAGGSIAG